jgi:hypothetical protein
MFKTIRRLVGIFTVLVVILGALKSVFAWLANNANDNHELFVDEEESERQF